MKYFQPRCPWRFTTFDTWRLVPHWIRDASESETEPSRMSVMLAE